MPVKKSSTTVTVAPSNNQVEDIPEPQIDGKKIKMDVVVGYLFNKTKKTFDEDFRQVFDKLLERISEDYEIPLDELQDNYQLECTFHTRKPRDPAQACLAVCKSGKPCSKGRKDGYDFCGTHLKMKLEGVDLETINDEDEDEDFPEDEPEPAQSAPKPSKKLSKPKSPKKKAQPAPEPEADPETTLEDPDTIDLEEIDIKGKTYLKNGNVLYEYPDEVSEDMNLDDLEIVGHLNDKGTVEWREKLD